MEDTAAALLARFSGGSSINDRWVAARELMAARQLMSVAETDKFQSAFQSIGDEARYGSDIERLVAVDLVVRLSNYVKKLAPVAKDILSKAVTDDFPSISLLSETGVLPNGAKPAELRENVAFALQHASGDWVIPYVVKALIREDRSQKCRKKLALELAGREQSIDRWLGQILNISLAEKNHPEENPETKATKLRGITTALAEAIREDRVQLNASRESGILLARFCRSFVPVSSRKARPRSLSEGAAASAKLLDEIFSVRLTLIVEPETYAVLETFEWWWRPLAYPKTLKDAVQPIMDKLITGITLRARWGQKSDSLSSRLKQSLQNRDAAARRLQQIADEETGLPAEIDDWLRGRVRKSHADTGTVVTSLQAVAKEDLTQEVAKILLDAEEAAEASERISGGNSMHNVRRLINSIKLLASRLRLEIEGRQGDIVEYLPLAHQTTSGQKPADISVEIIRPMVVRKRRDGSEDIIIRAIVTDRHIPSATIDKVYQVKEENNEY